MNAATNQPAFLVVAARRAAAKRALAQAASTSLPAYASALWARREAAKKAGRA